MPRIIDVTIVWDDWAVGASVYSMGKAEIQEMIYNYNLAREQALLFSFVPLETIRQWVWDVFAREPHEVIVDRIIF